MGIEARHLLTAVIMTAPGTIMMAKIIEPETETPQTLGGVRVEIPRTDVNIVDAAARGTTDGLHLMLNVIAVLVSFVALVALLNGAFGWVHGYVTWFPESIQTVLGWVFRPIAFAMGVPWHDSGTIGGLLGTRMVLNEFLAYAQLGPMRAHLDPVSFTIATFALCGFAKDRKSTRLNSSHGYISYAVFCLKKKKKKKCACYTIYNSTYDHDDHM